MKHYNEYSKYDNVWCSWLLFEDWKNFKRYHDDSNNMGASKMNPRGPKWNRHKQKIFHSFRIIHFLHDKFYFHYRKQLKKRVYFNVFNYETYSEALNVTSICFICTLLYFWEHVTSRIRKHFSFQNSSDQITSYEDLKHLFIEA